MLTQGYIGVSKDVQNRWKYHKRCKENPHLQHAIALHGWGVLVKQVLIEAEMDYCLGIETKLRPTDKIGWNIVKGGGHPPSIPWNKGKKASDKERKRLSELRIGLPSPRKGVKLSEELIEKMVAARIGRPSKLKGVPRQKQTVLKMTATVLSQKWKCPHCQKEGYSIGAGNRWHFDNCKSKGISWPHQ
jgi:hypothetical protein